MASLLVAALVAAAGAAAAARRFSVSGMVVGVDPSHQTVIVSHESIPGYMDAMVMPFRVRPKLPDGLRPGAKIAFTLVVDRDSSAAEHVRVLEYQSSEKDPVEARRLKLMGSILGGHHAAALATGQAVPDFALTDQAGRRISLSTLKGQVVAIDFVYTRCPLPDYCFRLSTNFAQLQKRFAERMGRDLTLLTVTFDPAHDRPDVLAGYARIWRARGEAWHFLTGSEAEVQRVCEMFDVGFWPDEGVFTHALHTAVIDREGRLVANLEGNQYSAKQLGDLVETVLNKK